RTRSRGRAARRRRRVSDMRERRKRRDGSGEVGSREKGAEGGGTEGRKIGGTEGSGRAEDWRDGGKRRGGRLRVEDLSFSSLSFSLSDSAGRGGKRERERGREKDEERRLAAKCFEPGGGMGFRGSFGLTEMIWFYRVLFPVVMLLASPFYWLRMRRRGGYRADFGQRFGAVPVLPAKRAGVRRIWLQAVSV